jgi:hypothetical protein
VKNRENESVFMIALGFYCCHALKYRLRFLTVRFLSMSYAQTAIGSEMKCAFYGEASGLKFYGGNPVPVPAERAPIKAEECQALISVHGINETFGRSIFEKWDSHIPFLRLTALVKFQQRYQMRNRN